MPTTAAPTTSTTAVATTTSTTPRAVATTVPTTSTVPAATVPPPTAAVTAPSPAPATPAPTPPPTSPPRPASTRLVDQLADTGGASKIVTVRAATWGSTTAELMAWEKRPSGWVLVHGPWTANVGYAGWAWDPGEATGRSPIGSFTFGGGFGTVANPGYALGWFVIGAADYWVEDPRFSTYNTHQVWPASKGKVPWGHFERLADYADAYNYAALINFNVPPSGSGRGSGIFLHEATGGSTAGCVSLPEAQLLALLRWIDGGTRIVMAPDDTIRSL